MKTLLCLLFLACLPMYAQEYIEWSKPFNYSVHDVRYSPDEKTVAVANADTITILSADDGHLIKNIVTGIKIDQLLFTPDGNSIIVRAYKYIYVWNIEQGKLTDSLQMSYCMLPTVLYPKCISLSPNGELLATTYEQTNDTSLLVVTEVKTGKEVLNKQNKEYRQVLFTHDGRTLVAVRSSFLDGVNQMINPTIELYNTIDFTMWSGNLSATKIDKLSVTAIDISYNDSLLALTTVGGATYIWLMDLKTKTITSPISTVKHPAINRIKFDRNTNYIFAGGFNGINFTAYNMLQPTSPYVFKDSFAVGRGLFGIDCSQNGNVISASSIDVVMSNNKWQLPVGVKVDAVKYDSVIFPNPTNGQVTIKTSYSFVQPISVVVIGITGKQYPISTNTSWEGNNYVVSFNAEKLSIGKYYVRLQAGNTPRTFTFTKE